MKIMHFNVQAVVGTTVIAHGTGDTLAQALESFKKKQAENVEEYADLSHKATRSIEQAVA